MSSKAGSSIGAFLLSLPVSAMLMMMVFGVPRFSPGTQGSTGWEQAREWIGAWQGQPGTRQDEFRQGGLDQARTESADPFARVQRGAGTGEAPRWGDGDDPRRPTRAGASDAAHDSRWPFGDSATFDSPRDAAGHVSPSRGLEGDESGRRGQGAFDSTPLTWSGARRKLADLGIERFHLEPGLDRDEYLFVCMFTPGDDPQITQRFEAEAGDPLEAVRQVLTQIDGWLAERYATRVHDVIAPRGGR